MITAELLTELKAIISEDQVVEGENHPLGNSGCVKVYPKTEEEIAAVLKYANDTRKKVCIEGSGTKRGFGGLTESTDILLSLSNYKGIVEHVVGDMTLTVKAGTTFKELQEYLAQHKQKISLDPYLPESATIGGIIASNESGPKRLGYGSSRDVVIGLRVVYPDGKVLRAGGKVVKNVAGYDMNKLFIGSMGTLGVLSEVTVKLRPLPKYESLHLLFFPQGNMEEIRALAIKLLDSTIEPVTLELLSPALSEKLTGKSCFTLAIGLEDVETSVRYQENLIQSMQPAQTDLKILAQQEAQSFWNQFYTITSTSSTNSSSVTQASLKIGVINMDVTNVIKESHLLSDTHNLDVDAHGGLGHGLCQVNLKGAKDDVVSAILQIRASVTRLGGYAVVKHLPFTLRQEVNVWGERPAHFFLLEGIKSKVDPNKILNPKRFVGEI
ncbi:glycolate oxidase FAD binding subunit [Bacillus sp. SLBN-46]|uniref:FAD-binding oxidoreductase n=1 Tax=Bacillus sp. SLBN-46 TaxID=3042283 RepID=UPI00285E1D5A|nr:FAD-binding oxidoreductase [Bacillus sp. SLBN-46]MDR6121772.1 glycolate oxidase FAD binding subunit [Bacillus sp. SLBN-46]